MNLFEVVQEWRKYDVLSLLFIGDIYSHGRYRKDGIDTLIYLQG